MHEKWLIRWCRRTALLATVASSVVAAGCSGTPDENANALSHRDAGAPELPPSCDGGWCGGAGGGETGGSGGYPTGGTGGYPTGGAGGVIGCYVVGGGPGGAGGYAGGPMYDGGVPPIGGMAGATTSTGGYGGDGGSVGGGGGAIGGGGGTITGGSGGMTGGAGGVIGGSGGHPGTGGVPSSCSYYGGTGGAAGAAGYPGDSDTLPLALASWNFDDCNPSQAELYSSQPWWGTYIAYRTLSVECAAGFRGAGVLFNGDGDQLYVPDEIELDFDHAAAVAVWINPSRVDGRRVVFERRASGGNAFALAITDGQIEWSVALSGAAAPLVLRSPIQAGVMTHVAGLFDGSTARLVVGGHQVGEAVANGVLEAGNGPLVIGASGLPGQTFEGVIDELWVSNQPVTVRQIAQLTCVPQAKTISVSPVASDPVPLGTTVEYHITVTNNDPEVCAPANLSFSTPYDSWYWYDLMPAFSVVPATSCVRVAPGESVDLTVWATSQCSVMDGIYPIPFTLADYARGDMLNGDLVYVLSTWSW